MGIELYCKDIFSKKCASMSYSTMQAIRVIWIRSSIAYMHAKKTAIKPIPSAEEAKNVYDIALNFLESLIYDYDDEHINYLQFDQFDFSTRIEYTLIMHGLGGLHWFVHHANYGAYTVGQCLDMIATYKLLLPFMVKDAKYSEMKVCIDCLHRAFRDSLTQKEYLTVS